MNLRKLLSQFLIIYPPFVLLDFTWFGFVVANEYQKTVGHLMITPEDCTAITFIGMFSVLALIVVGALLFVTPQVSSKSYPQSFLWGALYGIVTYGVYSLSSFIHFKGWPLHITLMDTAWGITVCGLLGMVLAFLNRS